MVDVFAAQRVMGKNFIGPHEGFVSAGVSFSGISSDVRGLVSFSETLLRLHKDTHILVFVPSISIIEMRRIHPSLFWEYDEALQAHRSMWYDKYPFFHDIGVVGWYLLKKTIPANTLWKLHDDQIANLGDGEYVPPVRVVAYTMLQYFLKTGERLFGRRYAQCSDRTARGNRIAIGCFDEGGLDMDAWQEPSRAGNVGLAVALKHDFP